MVSETFSYTSYIQICGLADTIFNVFMMWAASCYVQNIFSGKFAVMVCVLRFSDMCFDVHVTTLIVTEIFLFGWHTELKILQNLKYNNFTILPDWTASHFFGKNFFLKIHRQCCQSSDWWFQKKDSGIKKTIYIYMTRNNSNFFLS